MPPKHRKGGGGGGGGGGKQHPNYQAQARNQKQKNRQERNSFRKNKQKQQYGDASWKSRWTKFEMQMNLLNLTIKDVAGDGNCLFRALADQIEGDPSLHPQYRQRIVNHVKENREEYELFIEDDESFDDYTARMARLTSWGGHIEIHAATQVFHVNITVHQLEQPRWELTAWPGANTRMIHLSYHDGDHYASIRRRNEPAGHKGPPLAINFGSISKDFDGPTPETLDKQRQKQNTNKAWSEAEDLVSMTTNCWNIDFIRAVLDQSGGSVDTAVDFIFSSGGADDLQFQMEFLESATGKTAPGGRSSAAAGGDSDDPPWEIYSKDKNKRKQLSSEGSSESAASTGTSEEAKENPPEPPANGHDEPRHKDNKYHGKGGKGAAETAEEKRAGGAAGVHPKLLKWQTDHVSNKERQRQQREEKGLEKPGASSAAPAPAPVVPPESAGSGEMSAADAAAIALALSSLQI